MLENKLQDIGLTEKEAKIYVVLLERGKATAKELAQQSGVNRGTAYSILEILKIKGLVEERKVAGQVSVYVCTGANSLSDFLENEKRKAEDKIKNLHSFWEEVETINNMVVENKAKFVKGFSGLEYLRKIVDRAIKKKPKIQYEIFNATIAWKLFPIKKNDHRKTLQEQSKNYKAIIIYDPKEGMPTTRLKVKGGESRYLSQSKFNFTSEILVFDDFFIILDPRDDFTGFVIEHPHLVESMKAFFQMAWAGAEQHAHLIEKF